MFHRILSCFIYFNSYFPFVELFNLFVVGRLVSNGIRSPKQTCSAPDENLQDKETYSHTYTDTPAYRTMFTPKYSVFRGVLQHIVSSCHATVGLHVPSMSFAQTTLLWLALFTHTHTRKTPNPITTWQHRNAMVFVRSKVRTLDKSLGSRGLNNRMVGAVRVFGWSRRQRNLCFRHGRGSVFTKCEMNANVKAKSECE